MLKLLENPEVELLLKYLDWRYGIESHFFSNFEWVKSSRNIYLIAINALKTWEHFPVKKIGLRVLSGKQFPYRATTGFIQRFGKFASRGVISISQDQLEKLLTVGPLDLNLITNLMTLEPYRPGPIIIRVDGMDVGAGSIKENQLVSQISQGRVYQFLRHNLSNNMGPI